jgi:hypothetical protein
MQKLKAAVFLCFCIGLFNSAIAAVVYDTVYINKGVITTIDTNYYAFYAFNDSPEFVATNSRIHLEIGDSLYLSVINTDVLTHGFDVKNTVGYAGTVLPGETLIVPMRFNELGAFIFYDNLDDPKFRYLGLAGLITVDDSGASKFFWNVKDHEGEWNDSLDEGYTVDWSMYYPNYFTINGFSNPLINEDPNARITGTVGETIRVYIPMQDREFIRFIFMDII